MTNPDKANHDERRAARAPGVLATPWRVVEEPDGLWVIDAREVMVCRLFASHPAGRIGIDVDARAEAIVAAVNSRAEREAEVARLLVKVDTLSEECAVLGDAAGDLRTANDALREELRVARDEQARVTELADAYDRELTLAREYADGLERERDEARSEVEQLRSRLVGEKFEARRRDEELRVARETAGRLSVALQDCVAAMGCELDDYARWVSGGPGQRYKDARNHAANVLAKGTGSREPRRDDDPVGRTKAGPFAAVVNCQHSAQSWYRDASGVHCGDCDSINNKGDKKTMKYRKTALIDAIQWTGDNFDEIQAFNIAGNERPVTLEGSPPVLTIETLEGRMRAPVGHWIIRGVKGEVYACAPDIFATSYEPATQRDDDPIHEG